MAIKPRVVSQEKSDFVPVVPDAGTDVGIVSLIVELGKHDVQPKFAKDSKNKQEFEEDGSPKIIWPNTKYPSKGLAALYFDLANQTHDYGGDTGEQLIRLPFHSVSRGMSEGISTEAVAPRDLEGNRLKRPWMYHSNSKWAKLAAATTFEDGTTVASRMCNPFYDNPDLNEVRLLLGKACLINVEVKVSGEYTNVSVKNPTAFPKKYPKPDALPVPALIIEFEDDDLLKNKAELGGKCKLDFVRVADLRRIVIANDYPGKAIQKAIQQKFDEPALIKKALEIAQAIVDNDKELIEIYKLFPNGDPRLAEGDAAPSQSKAQERPPAVSAPSRATTPKPSAEGLPKGVDDTSNEDEQEDSPF
jgi:hypothetical protein